MGRETNAFWKYIFRKEVINLSIGLGIEFLMRNRKNAVILG